jgi:hypothetical protein
MNETHVPEAAQSSRAVRARWAVPAVVAVMVATAFAVPALASAGGADLPDVTPAELLASVVEAEPTPHSGTVVYTARLGLPDLPLTEMADAGPMSLLGGSSTVRVWTDGVDRSRIALLGATSEFSMVRDGLDAWTYSSADNAVVHYAPSAEDAALLEQLLGDGAGQATPTTGDIADPDQLAQTVLTIAEESSTVTMDADTTVAGRAAYQLVVTPTSADTLVERVVLAVDGETSLPLRLQVWSTQDDAAPALEVGYTDIAFGTPDAAVLEFSVPVGATVDEVEVPVPDLGDLAGLSGATLPEGFEGLADLDLSDLQGLDDLDPAKIADLTGLDPAELERIAGLEGPERIAAMQELMAGLDLEGLMAEVGEPEADAAGDVGAGDSAGAAPTEDMRILGDGWGTVIELSGVDVAGHLGAADADAAAATDETLDPDSTPGSATAEDLFAELDQSLAGMHDGADVDLFATLATEVPEGRLITSALLSILVTDDGRVLVGAVPGDVLRGMA